MSLNVNKRLSYVTVGRQLCEGCVTVVELQLKGKGRLGYY